MLLRKIAKTAYDALPDVMKAEYKVSSTNASEYLLDADDAKEALAARDREKARADELQTRVDAIDKKLKDAEDATKAAEAEALRKKGDIPALEASWQAKLDAAKVASDAAIDGLKIKLKNLLVKNAAMAMAADISTTPNLLAPMIEARLQAEIDVDTPFTRVLDAAGKPSALSLDDLKKELVANKDYSAIIKASQSSGGSAGAGRGGGSAGSGGGEGGKKLSEMTDAERVKMAREDPAQLKRLTEEAQQAARH